MSGIRRKASLLVLTGLILTFALAFYQLLQPFLLPLFLASILAIVVRPMYDWLQKKLWNKPQLAGMATTAIILSIVLLPLFGGLLVGSVELYDWSLNLLAQTKVAQEDGEQPRFIPPAIEAKIDEVLDHVNQFIKPREIKKEEFRKQLWTGIQKSTEQLVKNTPGVVGTFMSFILSAAIVILGMYFFLVDADMFVVSSERLFPLHADYQRIIRKKFVSVTRAVVLGTFLAAIAQGVATGIALRLAGFPQFTLLTVLATLSAIIPFAGTALIWVPCVIWLGITDWQGNMTTIIVLSAYELIVVGLLDNLIRAYVLNSDAKLHPLLAFLSVLGGLQWMGLWGVFVGPLVASCLHALMEIMRQEIESGTLEDSPAVPDPPAG